MRSQRLSYSNYQDKGTSQDEKKQMVHTSSQLLSKTRHSQLWKQVVGETADVKRKKLATLKYGNTEIRVAESSSKEIQETKTMILTQASSQINKKSNIK